MNSIQMHQDWEVQKAQKMKQQVMKRKHREQGKLLSIPEETKEDLDATFISAASRGMSNNQLEQSFDLFALQDSVSALIS